MKNYDLITPEGTKDLLFGESVVRRTIEDTLLKLFKSRGYSEIITPGLEFFDVFNMKSRYFPQENLYKMTDSKGRLIVMRPDSTMPIARVVATRLRDADLPLKLCYNQTVYRNESLLKGRSDETVQAGIELIGSEMKMADLEVISAAVDALNAFGLEFSLELGHIGVFKCLVDRLDADEKDKNHIRKLIQNKNFPALNDFLDTFGNNSVTAALKKLPALFGGEEVFEKAEELIPDENVKRILDELREIYCDIADICGNEGNITVDLGLVNKTDYYTGLIIKGYLKGHGDEVISGGRYDKLISDFGYDIPAVGFAVDVNAISKVIERNGILPSEPSPDVIVYAEEGCEAAAIKQARELREQGFIVENALFGDIESVREYAKEKKISKVVVVDCDSVED
ncbi:MAG: ATP phosphoribosyltransferase regulatory subunit [Ruminococcus sp.]|nr:ATP phosphoribosyltransferase regulatory subunit [Ruminococcus sp.]MBR3901898.1 ATP phosphoribosyltransferase regulatory subunit [Ruminococcus sp.]